MPRPAHVCVLWWAAYKKFVVSTCDNPYGTNPKVLALFDKREQALKYIKEKFHA